MILLIVIGLATGCVYALVAFGYSLSHRTTGIVNFAQGSYVMIGGLATHWFFTVPKFPYALAIVCGVATAALAGLVLWTLFVLPLWKARRPSYIALLETIIYGVVLSLLALLLVGPTPQTLPPWIPGLTLHIGDSRVDGQYIVIVVVASLAMVAMICALRYTTLGREMRACASNRDMSELLGISPYRVGLVSFTASAALGGLGGAVITPAQFTSPDAGLMVGVFGFVAAVIGGFGSISGAFLGGILLGLVNVFVAFYISSNYQTVIAFGILLVLLALRPEGLFGKAWADR
jgi:branched-chain amino acid transport system permease protein